MNETQEIGMFEALLKDVRRANLKDNKEVDELLEIIEVEYRLDRISDEMLKYLTRAILKDS